MDIKLIDIDYQLDDITTKPLTKDRFNFITENLNMHFIEE